MSDQKQTKMVLNGAKRAYFELNIIHYYWCASKNDHKCYNLLPRITGRVRLQKSKLLYVHLKNDTVSQKNFCHHMEVPLIGGQACDGCDFIIAY